MLHRLRFLFRNKARLVINGGSTMVEQQQQQQHTCFVQALKTAY